MKTITNFEIVNHGVDHEQYFPGCGITFTGFRDVATGIGNDIQEAFEDALNSLAQNGWDIATLPENLSRKLPAGETVHEDDDSHYYYLSVRVS